MSFNKIICGFKGNLGNLPQIHILKKSYQESFQNHMKELKLIFENRVCLNNPKQFINRVY